MQFCAICQDDKDDVVAVPCKHVFCKPCITKWKNMTPTCPCCRAPLFPGVDWLRVVHLITGGTMLAMFLYVMGSDAAYRNVDNAAAALKILLHIVVVNWDLICYFVRRR